MTDLGYDDFSDHVGTTYQLMLEEDGSLDLRLDEVEKIEGSRRSGGGFRLLFRGPAVPRLPQAIYQFRRDGREDSIFIVPVGCDQAGMQYEAVFF